MGMSGTYGPESPFPSVDQAVAPRVKPAIAPPTAGSGLTRYAHAKHNYHAATNDARDHD
jgi:hypothetical protein